jgi:hypothetical protein
MPVPVVPTVNDNNDVEDLVLGLGNPLETSEAKQKINLKYKKYKLKLLKKTVEGRGRARKNGRLAPPPRQGPEQRLPQQQPDDYCYDSG